MRPFLILFRRELKAYFVSPIAYVVIALVMVLHGFSFKSAMTVLEAGPSDANIVRWAFYGQWFWLSYFFIFPLLTMRLFAEEQKLGTMESLMTAPITATQIVLAKYCAALVLYTVMWLPSLFNFYLFQWVTHKAAIVPLGSLLGSYSIIFFMGLFNLAVGCLASSLTSNQIVAAILSFTISLLHFLLGFFVINLGNQLPPAMVELASYFASTVHINQATSGLIDTRPMVYYTSLSALCLFFTHQVLEYRRWKV